MTLALEGERSRQRLEHAELVLTRQRLGVRAGGEEGNDERDEGDGTVTH